MEKGITINSLLNLLQRTREVVEVVADGLNRRIHDIAQAATKIAAQERGVVGDKTRTVLTEMPFLSRIVGGMGYRSQNQTVGIGLYPTDKELTHPSRNGTPQ